MLRVKEIDFSKLSFGFGLLHLPKMPEIKKSVKYENFPIEFSSIPYKWVFFLLKIQTFSSLISIRDKHREAERQKALENGDFNKKKKPSSAKTISWSNNVEKKLKRKIKREQKEIVEKKKRKVIDDDDYDDLQEDFKLLKRLKKKKVKEIRPLFIR